MLETPRNITYNKYSRIDDAHRKVHSILLPTLQT